MKPNASWTQPRSLKIFLFEWLRTLMLVYIIVPYEFNEAQVISHELRRLAISTNQFGIDVLKALDRIEQPDKVIVYCPVCLSSSLAMILMGSSKYQVVSSLRHALYIWSMKPHDVNRGFKDMFDFIDLNRQQASARSHNFIGIEADERPDARSAWRPLKHSDHHYSTMSYDQYRDNLPLPTLIRMRELAEMSTYADFNSIDVSPVRGRSIDLNATKQLNYYPRLSIGNHFRSNNNNNNTTEPRYGNDFSQMSAISNIYIQRGINMNYQYNIFLRKFYRTVVHPVDFVRKGEETRQHINSLVALSTEGKIKDLVKTISLSAPRIMMITAFHFRGTLDVKMVNDERSQILMGYKPGINNNNNNNSNKSNELDANFNPKITDNVQNKKTFIRIQPTLLKYGQFESLNCSMIEIPFSNRLLSLLILVPNNREATELLLTKLSAQVLSDLANSLVVKKISLEIPIIKFDRGPINVAGLLKELGLDQIFFGDKLYVSEIGLNKWMRPSDIVHETSIDIGTYNAKHDSVVDRLPVGAHDNRKLTNANDTIANNHVVLDQPFFYFVLDSINGIILTMGRVRD